MDSEKPIYRLTIGREGQFWTADVEHMPVRLEIKRMAEVIPTVRLRMNHLVGNNFTLDVHYVFDGDDVTELVETYFLAADAFGAALSLRDAQRKAMVDDLAEEGMSYRAIAQIIGRSHQRVKQILDESPERTDDGQD